MGTASRTEARDARDRLRADCGHCFALCCVALPFTASADFAIDKRAGQPCPNLLADFGCGIHDRLRDSGFPGCTVYDCFGAGQQVAQVTFQGRDWRRHPETAEQMYAVFAVMRQLHEMLWLLAEARTLQPGLDDELRRASDETERLTGLTPEELEAFDLPAHRKHIGELLRSTSELTRAGIPDREDRSGADLIGANLEGADLHGASLRAAYLIGANLKGADLRLADLLGADLRGADLSDADLSDAIFVTQPELTAARGNSATRIPAALARPAHWTNRPRSRR